MTDLTRKQFLGRSAQIAGAGSLLVPALARGTAGTDPLHPVTLHQSVSELCAFGPRRTGTDAERRSADWLAGELAKSGCQVRVDRYPFRQWNLGAWDVQLTTAAPGPETAALPRRIATHPIWGMGHSAEGEADLVYVGYATDKELDAHDLRGKVAIVDGKVLLSVFSTFAGSKGAYWRLVERGAVAMLAPSDAPGNLVRLLAFGDNRLDASPIPAFTVGRQDFGVLRRAARPGGAKVRFSIDAHYAPGMTQDVVATLPGKSDREQLMVCAHHDSMFAGALDNATGVAGLIGLAHHFAARPLRSRPKTMTFLSVAGHDTGFPHLGVRHWMEQNPELMRRLTTFLTLDHLAGVGAEDLPGGLVRTGLDEKRALVMSNNAVLYALVCEAVVKHRLLPAFPIPEPLARPNPDLEGRMIEAGVPALNLTMAYPWYHTEQDTPDKIPAGQLGRSVRAYRDMLERLQRIPGSMVRGAERRAPSPAH